MHTGAYARNAAHGAVQLSLMLEEGLMSKSTLTVADYMVTTPVCVEDWHTVGYVRQLMLANSFSYLPIFWNSKWHLISDMAMAAMLQPLSNAARNTLATVRISEVLDCANSQLKLQLATTVKSDSLVETLLGSGHPGLWLVVNTEEGRELDQLIGVLSPFELM